MFNLPKDNFVFLETNRFDKDNYRSYLFHNPTSVISCFKLADVQKSFLELEDFLSKGSYAAGFISYEAGFSFEDTLKGLTIDLGFPLLWFGIYEKPVILRHKEKIEFVRHKDSLYTVKNLRPNISKDTYINNIRGIKNYIKQGKTYQVNYTFKYKFNFCGSLYRLYEDLKAQQHVSYSAFIKTLEFSILSLSPELFFRKKKNIIEVMPMKGTIERGRDLKEDRRNIMLLKKSYKDRSENVMIVDLLRNDLGRISVPGSVKTKKLFEVERYETLLQMISVVKSRLKKDTSYYDLFRAIFPSGSVTGAPKIQTMKIINSLENEPRNIYTGGIGFFSPLALREAVFNVAIRTVLINNRTGKGEMGIGSGIIYDSDPHKEYEECKLKASFITQKKIKDFRLIETILWNDTKGYFLLRHHLDRLSASAEYFNFKFDRMSIDRRMKKLAEDFKTNFRYRVRLLLDKNGGVYLTSTKINDNPKTLRIRFSDRRSYSKDIFLYHKTTNRILYDREYKRWSKKGYLDVIFTNEKDQVTEGAISNIVIKKGLFYYTPPIECGILNGVFRRHLFESKNLPLKEKVLYKENIKEADEIYMINSVRGMVKVNLVSNSVA